MGDMERGEVNRWNKLLEKNLSTVEVECVRLPSKVGFGAGRVSPPPQQNLESRETSAESVCNLAKSYSLLEEAAVVDVRNIESLFW